MSMPRWTDWKRRKAGAERQGRAKRFFRVKPSGLAALRKTLECVERMREGLPEGCV
jgi:hypothetical protein